MGIAAYYLLANPHMLAKVRDELQTLPEDPTLPQLTNLPYLSAVINEAHRLSFGVVKRQSRTASHETLTYEQYIFPPGTWLSTLSYCTHTNENIFPDPEKFDPERWLGPEGAERKRYQQVFGKGHRKCVGMNVADAEIVLAIKTFAGFDMNLFETDESDIKFRHEYHISHPKPESKGVRAVVRGKISVS
jgi:cytochrome P450